MLTDYVFFVKKRTRQIDLGSNVFNLKTKYNNAKIIVFAKIGLYGNPVLNNFVVKSSVESK